MLKLYYKWILLGVISVGVVLGYIHYITLVHNLELCNTRLQASEQEVERLIALNADEFKKFTNTIYDLNASIKYIGEQTAILTTQTDAQVDQYKVQVKQLESSISTYKQKLAAKPQINTCDAGFNLIIEEIREKNQW